METIKLPTKTFGKKTLFKGKAKKFIINKYYNLDGSIIDEGQDKIEFDSDKEFEIFEEKRKIYDYEFEVWTMIVDGKPFATDYELTGYKVQKTQVVLRGCTGCG